LALPTVSADERRPTVGDLEPQTGSSEKTIVWQVTGTNKVAILTPQKLADKVALRQLDADAKELKRSTTNSYFAVEGTAR